MEPKVKEIVEKTFHGGFYVSQVFTETKNNQNSIGLAVPVYKDGESVGVLSGSYPTAILENLLNNSDVQDGIKENVDLIQKDGTFVVLSDQSLVEDKKENIFKYDTYSEEDKAYIINQMNEGLSFKINYSVAGNQHLSRFTPVGELDWYLIYSDTTNERLETFYSLINFVQIVLGIIIIVVVITILWFYINSQSRQKELEEIAYYDSLTNAFNIFKFQEEVRKSSNHIKGVATINVSRFRFINYEFGKEKADRLLITISQAIKKNLEENEFYAREYADSFWIAFAGGGIEEVKNRLENIVNDIDIECKPWLYGYKVKLFIGVAPVGECRIDLIERARFSLRESKKKNHDNITFWTEIEEELSDEKFYVESHKESALNNGEFKMVLQPKMNYNTGEVDSAEVLVRWMKPDGKMIYPDQFIQQFEENGFCIQLDLYMFEQACKTLRKWMDENKKVVRLSVNQSKVLFYKEDYVELLCEITEKYQINPELLTLEILENLAIYNMDRMNHVIKKLREKGFFISMDDFGSGYSSLNSLGSLKVNEIKMDRCFLKNLDEEENNKIVFTKLVKAIKLMNISVVVEGVETKENENFVQLIQADYGQGYYYSKPMFLEEFEKQYNLNLEN